jgi:uncharacterized protein (TIGR03086 family)
MVDLLELRQRNADRFDDLVRQVGERWHAPTPCTDWDVRALVNHLTVEQLWVPPLLQGHTIEEVGHRFDGDVLGSDPVASWDAAIAASTEAWNEPGALDRTVHLSYGDTPASRYLGEMAGDLAVHGWDLARALGVVDVIDPDTVEFLLEEWGGQADQLSSSGLFAPPVPVAMDADPQTRLLATLGRTR